MHLVDSPVSPIASSVNRLVVGLGATGISTMRHLRELGLTFSAYDQRRPADDDIFWENISALVSDENLGFKDEGVHLLRRANVIYLSPGVSPDAEWLISNVQPEVKISGDLDLFANAVNAPVIAITGSNAKSTVTTLVGEMALESGIKVAYGGNLGTPMLDLIDDDIELYVLELSSFQLERSDGLQEHIACILNLSDDHLDRHGTMPVYHAQKQRIYRGAKQAVFNRDDLLTQPLSRDGLAELSFGFSKPLDGEFGFDSKQGSLVVCSSTDILFDCDKVQLIGKHNLLNAMAAFAIGVAAGFEQEAMRRALYRFKGLPHRSELVEEIEGIRFINDSKATNVGAAIAAIDGLSETLHGGCIHLIVGGVAKGGNFEPLLKTCLQHKVRLLLIGEAADKIERQAAKILVGVELAGAVLLKAESLEEAVDKAYRKASSGDVVLLAPACASFDMFENYQQRGDCFKTAVSAIADIRRGGFS